MSATTVPQRVTIEVSGNGHDGLVEDELVALLDELADLHARAVRFAGLTSADEAISLRLLHRAGDLGMVPIVEVKAAASVRSGLVDRLIDIRPRGIAAQLHDCEPGQNDALTGQPGSFAAFLRLAEAGRKHDFRIEVDTLVRPELVEHLESMGEKLRETGVSTWNLRIDPLDASSPAPTLAPSQVNELFDRVLSLVQDNPVNVVLEELLHFRRYLAQRSVDGVEALTCEAGRGRVSVLDSRFTVHISKEGEVYPSRLLRIPAGNVRRNVLRGIFMHHPTYSTIREPHRLRGPCGRCRFDGICGGSRARAWLATGDPLASDPACDEPIQDRDRRQAARPWFGPSEKQTVA